jgi:hypothetical protein
MHERDIDNVGPRASNAGPVNEDGSGEGKRIARSHQQRYPEVAAIVFSLRASGKPGCHCFRE